MKLFTGLLGVLGLSATAWSGAWVYGKSAIQANVDEQIALMREQGIEASYGAIEIGGFPFGYDGRLVQPRYAMAVMLEGENGFREVIYRWSAPWMEIDASVADLGGLSFTVADEQTIALAPVDGAVTAEAKISSSDLRGRLAQVDGRTQLDGGARSLRITVVPPPGIGGQPLTVNLSNLAFSADGSATVDESPEAPKVAFSASADQFSLISKITGAPQVFAIADALKIVAGIAEGRVDAEFTASKTGLGVTAEFPVAIETGSIKGAVSGPAMPSRAVQRLTVTLDVVDADPGATVWNLFDPSGAFPREIARLYLDAEADGLLTQPLSDLSALLTADSPLTVRNTRINSLIVDAAGLEMDAEGAGTLIAGQPEGAAILRLTGVNGFIDNAVTAGLVPEQQAGVYKLMVKQFARKGATVEQSVFNVTLRNGMTFVNGLPVGPAPALPR